MKRNQEYSSKKIGGDKLTLSTHTGRALLAALLLTGAFCVPVEAANAPQTKPVTVTKTNQTINDDFGTDSNPVSITDGLHDAVVDIPASVTGGTIQVNSKTIEGSFTQSADDKIMEANGVYIHGGYTGKVQFADGLNVSTTATGSSFNADCIYLTGVEDSYDSKGHMTEEKTDNVNEAYKKNGRVADAYGIVGKNTTLTLTGKPVDADYLNMAALESHFAHMNVGGGLNVSVTTGPAKNLYVSGLDVMYYGQIQLGSGNTIKIQADTGDTANVVDLHGIYSSHDHPSPYEEQLPALGRQKLDAGDDTNLVVDFTSSPENTGYVENTGAFLSNTDFTFGNWLHIQNTMKGSGVLGDTGSLVEGIFAQSSAGYIGQDFTDTVTFSNGQISRLRGVNVYGHGKQSSLTIGDNSQVNLTVDNGNVSAETKGYVALDQGKISTGDHAHTSITIKGSTMQGSIAGLDAVDHGSIQMGDDAQVSIDADKDSALYIVRGAYVDDNSRLAVKNGYTSHIAAANNQVGMELLGVFGYSIANLGNDAKETLSLSATTHTALGHDINGYGTLNMGNRSDLSMQIHGEEYTVQINGKEYMARPMMVGNTINNQSKATYGNEGKQSLMMDGIAGTVIGNQVQNQSALTIGNGQTDTISVQGIVGSVVGNNVIRSNLTVGNNLKNIITVSGKDAAANIIAGDVLSIARNDGVNLKTGNGYTTIIWAEGNNGNSGGVNGMYTVNGAKASVGDGAVIDIQDRYTGTQSTSLYGIRNQNAEVTYGNHLREALTGENVGSVYGIYSDGPKGKTQVGDDALLQVNASGKNTYGVYAQAGGQVDFAGGAAIQMGQNQDAIYSTGEGSSVTALGNGRKIILGDLESVKGGSINLNLNTADSLLRGKSTVDGFTTSAAAANGLMAAVTASDTTASVGTELSLANGARWDMTADSQLTKLDHENGGVVNMAYNPELQRLDVNSYSGNNGVFRMKSDLDNLETADKLHADKVYIKDADAGSTGLIQVHDQSFLTGHEVTGTKYQLLITDKSGKAKFGGTDLDDGGLWDVTPTIQNGTYVHDVMGVENANDKQWYLTKLERKVNKDTIPLMKAADNSYALYRLDIDSLRKRMGDLRFRSLKDTSGLWARDFHGAYDGRGVDSKYNGFQLGYDYAANEKRVYGFFAERNISNPKYSYGSSKDHALSGGLYGTWLGDSGVYTDVVAKWGRDDTELHTWGGYPDSANYRTWNESLSVEFGKTFTRDNGLFLEPEAQMVFGHLGSKDYTTSRGKTVSMGSYDSAIGRLGILLGKRVTDRENPYDYYLKFSLLHEFGGERNFHLAAPDGETMDYSEDYRDTWYEAGFGGTWHINDRTSLYADAERSFNGDWHKKWQWNIGVNWQF